MISPRNFDCAQVMDLLDDYRRNEIEPHLRVLISEHLAQCDACAAELRTREALAEAMRATLPPSATPAHLPAKVRREIASQRAPQPAGRRSAQLLPWMLAAAVVVTIGVAMLQMHSATPLQRSTEIAAVSQDYARESKPVAAQADMQPPTEMAAPSQTPATKSRKIMYPPPAAAQQKRAAPAVMQSRTAPQSSQQGFAPPQGFSPAPQQAEPATLPLNRLLMGTTAPALQDQATTVTAGSYFADDKSTASASRQSTGSVTNFTAPQTTTAAHNSSTTAPQ